MDIVFSSFGLSLLAALIVSALSFVGVVIIFFNPFLRATVYLLYLLSLSAGAMLGAAFFHLLPEAIENGAAATQVLTLALLGFVVFFVIEKFLHWHHASRNVHHNERLGYINLFADGLHNFLDGLAIVASFAVSPSLGLAVTAAVALHEIPQEIGDFGVLLYAGFTKKRALLLNFAVAVLAVVGVVVGQLLLQADIKAEAFLIPIAAGSFLYIAASDLIPELHKEEGVRRSLVSFAVFLAALLLMYVLKIIFQH